MNNINELAGQWYAAAGLILIAVLVVVRLTMFLTHESKAAAYSAVLITLLVTGGAVYPQSAPAGGLALGACFILALLEITFTINQSRRKKDEFEKSE